MLHESLTKSQIIIVCLEKALGLIENYRNRDGKLGVGVHRGFLRNTSYIALTLIFQ